MWQNPCFKAIFPVCLGSFIIIWKNFGPRNKSFLHSLRTSEGFEKCSQNGDRVGYLPVESNISKRSKIAYLETKVDMLFFTIKHCQNFTLTKGHGAGVTVGKCMRIEIFFAI